MAHPGSVYIWVECEWMQLRFEAEILTKYFYIARVNNHFACYPKNLMLN